MGFFGYDLTTLLKGRVNIYLAAYSVTRPTRIADIVDQESPYAPKTGWRLLGASSGATVYNPNVTTGNVNIQQTNVGLLREVTDVTRTIAVPACETTKENLTVFEESPGLVTVTAAAHKSAEKQVPVGSILDLSAYRVAFIGRFLKSQQEVIESGGTHRGAMVGFVGFNGAVLDRGQVSFGEGELVTIPLTFTLDPDPAVTAEGTEVGMWVLEQPGTIASS